MDTKSTIKILYLRAKNWLLENENLLVLGAGFILVTAISFGLGRLWEQQIGAESAKAPIVVNKAKTEDMVANISSAVATSKFSNQVAESIIYIASKKGEYYHLPSCPGGKAIKPENKIGFSSKEEAEKAGYKPAKNCPGL